MSEAQYWSDKAALLDPACHTYYRGTSAFSVSHNERVYLLNAWQLTDPNRPGHLWFHRDPNAEEALALPPNYEMKYSGTPAPNISYTWYARPGLVQSSDTFGAGGTNRYTIDPKSLYFERIERLKNLPIQELGAAIPQNYYYGSHGACPTIFNTFPANFERAIIRHVSMHNICWGTLQSDGSGVPARIAALYHELDDIRPYRFAFETCVPFLRSMFPCIYAGQASVWWQNTGNWSDPIQPVAGGGQTYPGYLSVKYSVLPEDF